MMTGEYIITSKLRIFLFYGYLIAIGILAVIIIQVVQKNRDLDRKSVV